MSENPVPSELTIDMGKPVHRFYLGYKRREAEIRKQRLECLWQCVERKEKQWTPLTLAIGKAIAKGQSEMIVDEWLWDISAIAAAHDLIRIEMDFPVIRFISHLVWSGGGSRPKTVEEARKRIAEDIEKESQIWRMQPLWDGAILTYRGRRYSPRGQGNSVIVPILYEFQRLSWPNRITLPDIEGDVKQALYHFNKCGVLRLSRRKDSVFWSDC